MMDATFPLTAGLIASVLHVIAGPDHLAAVAPFAIESKRKAWKIGLFWGIGHLLGMIAIGLLFSIFKEIIPVDEISKYSEQLVGFVLLGIGCWALYRIFKKRKKHKHLHLHTEHNPVLHTHEHQHAHDSSHHHVHSDKLKQNNFASFSIGILHGLAGISHFLLFLPVLGFETQTDSIAYIIGFAAGILVAMITFAFVIGKVSSMAKNGYSDMFFNGIRMAGGLFAIIIGVYWIFST
ncbi:sulfite exporter TauE/SafE family protein [Flagellimonas zhangzhouensis]|uniref:Cytochrome C biogenesis protein transmembrane region n=1 Tax=Flagellimonas zhangzhouensis TaxID=1073328 RepID=A0A1H2QDU5_9FLAO|nr:sulfite exporter TauE/SafE family protein [Allomuricauda zhangzhouensis]SDQ51554.1 Cytochrome C biogenesis protein transmembrane region [Allomuricauda zhangzhouensis]SDW04978.1 Cytochrome C biogenesis protein transmembrane region [Allomuricauda zhangzhouensis]